MAKRELFAFALGAALTALPATARAEDEIDASSLRAEKLAAEAEAKVNAKAFEKAIELYTAAYKEAPAAVLLFDMAWIYDRHLGSKMEAVDLYRRALDAGDLEPRLAKLADERLSDLQGVKSTPRDQTSSTPDKKTEGGWSTLKIGGVATAGVGVLAIGSSLVLGALAKSKDDEAAQFCNGDRCTDARALSLTDDATGLATGANVMFITGAVLLVGGVVMWLVSK